tara:strand:- start:567 stop:740 length:174 start_codon:yes stop_codon:yes gene_type:complete
VELFEGRYKALPVFDPASVPEPASFACTEADSREIRKIEQISEADIFLEVDDGVFLV